MLQFQTQWVLDIVQNCNIEKRMSCRAVSRGQQTALAPSTFEQINEDVILAESNNGICAGNVVRNWIKTNVGEKLAGEFAAKKLLGRHWDATRWMPVPEMQHTRSQGRP